jgi:hypothetical protein
MDLKGMLSERVLRWTATPEREIPAGLPREMQGVVDQRIGARAEFLVRRAAGTQLRHVLDASKVWGKIWRGSLQGLCSEWHRMAVVVRDQPELDPYQQRVAEAQAKAWIECADILRETLDNQA